MLIAAVRHASVAYLDDEHLRVRLIRGFLENYVLLVWIQLLLSMKLFKNFRLVHLNQILILHNLFCFRKIPDAPPLLRHTYTSVCTVVIYARFERIYIRKCAFGGSDLHLNDPYYSRCTRMQMCPSYGTRSGAYPTGDDRGVPVRCR